MVCYIDTGRIDDRALSRTAPDSDRLRDMLAALWLVMDAGPFRALGYRFAPAQARGHLAGANAILDVKMRTIPFAIDISMDFTLVGTAVHVEGLAPSDDPIVATVPALEFVKLLEADVVPPGIAVGAHYEWLNGGMGPANLQYESRALGELWGTAADTGSSRATKERLFTRQRRACSRQFYPGVHTQTTIPRAPLSWWPLLWMRPNCGEFA